MKIDCPKGQPKARKIDNLIIENCMSIFELNKTEDGVRKGTLNTAHGALKTPFFMPVGTQGTVKSISPNELKALGAQIVLSNTYHLYLRPGEQLIKELGGLHNFMRWDGPILTDSGGYQVFSLGQNKQRGENGKGKGSLVKILDEGVEFTSYLDGSKHLFTPEKVVQIQLDLGVDIIMPLDVCPSGKATRDEVKKACDITIDWARRSKMYFDRKMQDTRNKKQTNLNGSNIKRPLHFGIVQGGLDSELRKYCADELMKLNFDGYAVGGLAVDNETRDMWATVALMGEILPSDKPRYLMGVGTPDDINRGMHLGMDMFDCVLPTRLGRHGSVYAQLKTKNEKRKAKEDYLDKYQAQYTLMNLLRAENREDGGVIDKNCACPACAVGYSRAYISHLIRSNEILGMRLCTMHNLYVYLSLVDEYNGFRK